MNSDGELHLSHNGAGIGMQVCADCSQPLWMFFVLHGAIMQIRLLGMLDPLFPNLVHRKAREGQIMGEGVNGSLPALGGGTNFGFIKRKKYAKAQTQHMGMSYKT